MLCSLIPRLPWLSRGRVWEWVYRVSRSPSIFRSEAKYSRLVLHSYSKWCNLHVWCNAHACAKPVGRPAQYYFQSAACAHLWAGLVGCAAPRVYMTFSVLFKQAHDYVPKSPFFTFACYKHRSSLACRKASRFIFVKQHPVLEGRRSASRSYTSDTWRSIT